MYKINKQFFSPETPGLDLFNMYNQAINNNRGHLIIISKNNTNNTATKNPNNNDKNNEEQNSDIALINKLGILEEDKVLANLDLVKSNNYAINAESGSSHSSSLEIEPLEEIRELVSLLL